MSQKQKKRSRYIKSFKNGTLSTHPARPASAPRAGRWYTGIQELPLRKCINTIVTGKLQELIIDGEVDMNTLMIAWMPMYEAFLDGMQDKNGRQRTKDLSTLERYKWEFELIQLC